jgi:pimeloyl-ACP methyl ester carboxylesterase
MRSPIQSNPLATETHQTIPLRDGRLLGYEEYGDPWGQPIIYCHGFPGSRIEARLTEHVAHEVGARVVAIDRPGYGFSTFKAGRTLADWPNDVVEAADALGWKHFAILGISGGGPYALACAQSIPERLTKVSIVCGLGPMHTPGSEQGMGFLARQNIHLARSVPPIARFLYEKVTAGWIHRYPALVLSMLTAVAPEADRKVLSRQNIRDMFLDSTREAFRQGGQGPAWDLTLLTSPWDINPAHISLTVQLWHGEMDGTVPVAMGRHHAKLIPHCQATFLPTDGHFSLPVNQMESILTSLLS